MSENTKNLQRILEFTKLLHKFRSVNRTVSISGTDREENDVEHSYMLAMLADYVVSIENLKLDRHKVMLYCLTHDLVEAYAGDTYFYSHDSDHVNSKHKREFDALNQMQREFPEHENLWKIIENYEAREDEESRFVYALDKVQPVIHIYLDGGKSWKKYNVKLEHLTEKKNDKIKISPVIEKYWNELLEILERNQSTLFPK
ncbi:MAG: HD domain-containing protein [Candidatus Zambryskibacteria bacterium]|nr:HD domain-containing protein [Candidatus Zambryskibacteria bacterium]